MSKILLAYYGDDFTGSTDALEFICRAGANAVLFMDPPTAAQLGSYPGLNAYGIAGKTRSIPVEEMNVLLDAFEKMKSTGAKHIHYKVCSTFDSSPAIGSIGRAIDYGAAVFKSKTIPVLGGTPALGRYCVFGNLFAGMGTGTNGTMYRLDKHPSMSKHPVTPADESDLRLHLGKQTTKSIGLIDLLQLEKSLDAIHGKEEVLVIDALYEEQLLKIGEWIEKQSEGGNPLFSVGSSGIEMALGKFWNKTGLLQQNNQWEVPARSSPLLVVSGSCSPVTTAQIAYAKSHGFEEVILDAEKIGDVEEKDPFITRVIELLQQQKNVLVHTGSRQARNVAPEKLGTYLGKLVKEAALMGLIKRVVVAGGDTSSYTARAMEIEAVQMIAPVVSGAPLCKAISTNKAVHNLEVNFKGGQVGSENYFELF